MASFVRYEAGIVPSALVAVQLADTGSNGSTTPNHNSMGFGG
jgi:hypothetical protein